jgi:hypothetical protein
MFVVHQLELASVLPPAGQELVGTVVLTYKAVYVTDSRIFVSTQQLDQHQRGQADYGQIGPRSLKIASISPRRKYQVGRAFALVARFNVKMSASGALRRGSLPEIATFGILGEHTSGDSASARNGGRWRTPPTCGCGAPPPQVSCSQKRHRGLAPRRVRPDGRQPASGATSNNLL